jgi:small subunit ribosomal protein S8
MRKRETVWKEIRDTTMTMTDPIADMLTRIRNANQACSEYVDIPKSKLKVELVRILKSEGYIEDFKIMDAGNQGFIRLFLKYTKKGEGVIRGIERASTPGCRYYVGVKETPRPFGGLGVAILSTSKGIMTNSQSKSQGLGGEVLCYVW